MSLHNLRSRQALHFGDIVALHGSETKHDRGGFLTSEGLQPAALHEGFADFHAALFELVPALSREARKK
jgi:hypothetical protein